MYSRGLRVTLVVAVVLALAGASAAVALAKSAMVSKPVLSEAPLVNDAFTVSGFTTPSAKKGVKTVVKIQVLMPMDGGAYEPVDSPVKAKLTRRNGASGYKYSAPITVPTTGAHAVRATRYADGKVVGTSRTTLFVVTAPVPQIAVDSDSHADVEAPAGVPLDVVFRSPSGRMCGRTVHFVAGPFTKTSSNPLTYHCDGLTAGSYPWQCDMGPACCGGLLLVR